MKRVLSAAATLALLLATPGAVQAQPKGGGPLGVGLVLGYPHVGLSFNYFLGDGTSLQIDPVFHIRSEGGSGFGARLDLLFWPSTLAKADFADVLWYIGPGVNVYAGDGFFSLGAEAAVGIGLAFRAVPIDLNVELVPVLHILDNSGVNIDFGIGGALNARYYF